MFTIRPAVIRGSISILLMLVIVGYAGAATIKGSSASETLRGTAKADRLLGRGGNDVLFGRAGNDVLDGGSGDDRVYGDAGSDRLIGGAGRDRLFGGPGNDVFSARDGRRDVILCGAGRDRVVADVVDAVGADCESTSAPVQNFVLSVSTAGGGSVSSDPAGIACGADCSQQFKAGTAVTLTAAATSGQRFVGWTGACTGTGACEVFLDASRAVRATFAAAPPPPPQPPPPPPSPPPPPPPPPPAQTFNLSVTVVGAGTVTSSPGGINCGGDCSEAYASGTTVTLTATPGGTLPLFIGWAGACIGPGGCSVTMNGDQSVTALFSP